jgi:hypothetical protein
VSGRDHNDSNRAAAVLTENIRPITDVAGKAFDRGVADGGRLRREDIHTIQILILI